MKSILVGTLVLLTFASCQKALDNILKDSNKKGEFSSYVIKKGQHSSDQSSYTQVEVEELRFVVKFDSSAIYRTVDPQNQEDINKLFGFSDNNAQHHSFSARFGWAYTRNALRIYAYVYNNGERYSQEIAEVLPGIEYNCSIKVTAESYAFAINHSLASIKRESTTLKAVGYKLYPYFGGDETAPHDITVWIKEL